MVGFGDLRVLSQATTLVLSEYKVINWFEMCGAKVYMAAHAAKSSSQAMSTFGNAFHPLQDTNQGFSCSIDMEKYFRPQYPPIPPDNDAST